MTRGAGARGAGAYQLLRLLGLALSLAAVPAAAQPGPDPAAAVSAVEAAYEALDYAQAEALARQALARSEAFTRAQLVRLHTTLGLLLFARNDALGASEQFRAALSLDQALTLDPVLVSPVTLAFFDETKGAFLRERAGEVVGTGPAVRYVVVRDVRPDAALRSIVLPGWGQRMKGQRAKGWVLTGAWAGALGASVATHIQRGRARQEYLRDDITDPDSIAANYRHYNRWHRARGALLLGAGVVWAAAIVDALATGAPEAPGAAPARLAVEPAGAGLRLRFRF
jgi:tetratricopeptide (TPR) repeat protein